MGRGVGKMGALEAAEQAIANPLLNLSIQGAHGVLFFVKSEEELTLGGVNAAGELTSRAIGKDAIIFFGISLDESPGDSVKITLIGTGLKEKGLGWNIASRARALIPRS